MNNTVERVIQSPDKDAIGDMATYCVGMWCMRVS